MAARIGLFRPTNNLQSSDNSDAVKMAVSLCTKLCFKCECVQIDHCTEPITGEACEQLQEHLKAKVE